METVELVDGSVYASSDHWVTVYRRTGRGAVKVVKDRAEADRVRFIAVVQHGGGRDD